MTDAERRAGLEELNSYIQIHNEAKDGAVKSYSMIAMLAIRGTLEKMTGVKIDVKDGKAYFTDRAGAYNPETCKFEEVR